MTKLNDTQLVLLTTASQRENGSCLPLPETLTTKPAQIRKALHTLIEATLVTEVEVRTSQPFWREEGDRRFGAVISDAGRAALGLGGEPTSAAPQSPSQAEASNDRQVRAGTKQALLLELVQREQGASIDEIVEATGWLAHTARAAMTGLRKRGHDIILEKSEGASRYRCKPARAE